MMLKYTCWGRHGYFVDGSLGLTQELEELWCSLASWFMMFGIRGNPVTQVYMCVQAEHDV